MNARQVAAAMIVAAASVPSGAGAQTTTFKAGVDLVRVDVSVTRGGQPVRGLSAADFSIADSGVAQRVNSVTMLEDLPVSVVLVLDTSGSVEGERLRHLVEAGRGVLANLRPDDRAGLLTFSDRVELRARLGSDRRVIADALGAVEGKHATALNDAIWAALQLSPNTQDTRPLVLVFSDGVDNASWLGYSALLEAVRRTGIVIHAVELASPVIRGPRGLRPAPISLLANAANLSGGRSWSVTSSRDLQTLFTQAIDEMRARYLVTFYPENVSRPGWHPLKIGARGRGEIVARPGYFKAP